MDLSIEIRTFDELDKMLPAGTVESDVFTNKAVDVGAPIPILFGKCYNVWCPNVQNNTTDNYYDYLIGYGTLKGLLEDTDLNLGVKRDGVLVDSSEYTFHSGTQATPYIGYAFLRFANEQRDFSNRFYNVSVDTEGMELLGEEKIGNGDCLVDTHWTVGADWTHDAVNGEYDFTYVGGPGDDLLSQALVLNAGTTYEVTFTLKNANPLTTRVYAACGIEQGATRTTDGTYTEETPCLISSTFYMVTVGGSGSVTDISVKPVHDRNFIHIIGELLQDTTYGLSENISRETFISAASACTTDLLCDFPITEREAAKDILSELLFACRSKLYRTEGLDWGILQDDVASSLASFGDNDGYYNNCTVEEVSATPTNQSIKELSLEYNLYHTPVRMVDDVNAYGRDRVYRFRCFTEDITAKNVFSYIKHRSMHSSKIVRLTAGAEARELVAGNVFTLYAPARKLNAQDYVIQSIQRGLAEFAIEGRLYDSEIFTYATFTNPATFSQDYGSSNSPKYINGEGITGVMQSTNWGADDGVLIDFSNEEVYFGGFNSPDFSFVDNVMTLNGVFNITEGTIDGGVIIANTINADALDVDYLSVISQSAGSIIAGSITGAVVQTAKDGKRIVMRSSGITLQKGEGGYGSSHYTTDGIYGAGVLAYINHSIEGGTEIPFVIGMEQDCGDFRFFDRANMPTGTGATGDIAFVDSQLVTCVTSGSPASWAVVGPNMCRFAVDLDTADVDDLAINTNATIPFNNVIYDIGNDYDETATHWDFEAPMAGTYHFDLTVRLGDIDQGADYYRLGLVTDGETIYNTFDPEEFADDISIWTMTLSADVAMDAGDTAIGQMYQSNGNQQVDIDRNVTRFSGHAVYQQEGG